MPHATHRPLTRALAAVAAAVASAAAALGGAPIAGAADGPGADWVVFGDSFAANPAVPAANIMGPSDPTAADRHAVAGRVCPNDANSWPRVAARLSGIDPFSGRYADYSCNGTGRIPGVTILDHVDTAISSGDVGPGTDRVFMMYGGLDALMWADTAAGVVGQPDFPSAYVAEIRAVADRLRAAAPRARLTVVGYPDFGDGDRLCLIDVASDTPTGAIVPGSGLLQDVLRDTQRDAAEATGMGFIDMRAATAGHGTCAAPSERYVSGAIDLKSRHNMRLHPTINGAEAMGRIVADHVR